MTHHIVLTLTFTRVSVPMQDATPHTDFHLYSFHLPQGKNQKIIIIVLHGVVLNLFDIIATVIILFYCISDSSTQF